MNFKIFIAKRYLFANKDSKFVSFITYVSILGVTLGVAALIIAISIMNGFEKEIKDKVAGLVSHVQINSFQQEGLSDADLAIEKIKSEVDGVTGISKFIQKEAVIRYKDNIEGILLKGIDVENDLSTTRNKIIKGSFNLSPVDSSIGRLLIGQKLADKLGLDTGNKVIVFGLNGIPSPLNQPKIKQFIISGIYETGLRDYDDLIIYTDIPSSQKLFEMGSNVSGIELKLNDIELASNVVFQLKKMLGYPYYPKSLFELYRPLFNWVDLQKAPTPIILSLIILVAIFNIVSTLLMLVLEKTQSIGILKSLGVSNIGIMKIFIYDGLLIGLIGVVAGNIIGLSLCYAELKFNFFRLPDLYYMKSVPIIIQPEIIVLISVVSLVLCFLATLIPSYLASRFEPVKSMKFA
ncbi:MAG TPA: ABC transporter permease [Ignavibacteria bacterium]|nr:ABC transporter permease [Ignavibacteria bacterium]